MNCPNTAHSPRSARGRVLPRKLAPALLCALFLLGSGLAAAVEQIKIGGSGATLGTMRVIAQEFSARNPDIGITIVPNLGSSGSVKALAAGALSLSLTSRPLNDKERELGVTETEYARSPFVFAVSAKSSVAAVTRKELAEIYAGSRMKWPDGTLVRIILRPSSDIDSDMVKSLSPALALAVADAEKRAGVHVSITDQDAADDLERIPGAIGPATLAVIVSEKRALKALKLDSVEPSVHNAASGAYPYHKRMFLVRGAKRTPAAERLYSFMLSPAGRRILIDNGHWIP